MTVRVPPNAIAVEVELSDIVIDELLNDELPIFDKVFEPPDIVLLVNVCAALTFTNAVPPAVELSCTRNVSRVVSTDISPDEPVKELFCVVVPLLNLIVVGIFFPL